MSVINNGANRVFVQQPAVGAGQGPACAAGASGFASLSVPRLPRSSGGGEWARLVQTLLDGLRPPSDSRDGAAWTGCVGRANAGAVLRGKSRGRTGNAKGPRGGQATQPGSSGPSPCGSAPSGPAAQLAANRAKWQRQGPESYSYTLQRGGFVAPDARRPVEVTVQGGTVTGARFADSGEPLPESLSFNALSVDDLFGLIDEAIKGGAARVDVRYDAISGFPREVYIDYDEMIADEELSLTANNLVARSNPYLYPTRDVLAIADRMPTIIEPGQEPVPRDYVILGAASSYPAPVKSITIGAQTTPVTLNNGEYSARGLSLSGAGPLQGYLTLADGSRIPLNIALEYAY